MHSTNTDLVPTVLGTVLGSGDMAVKATDKNPHPVEVHSTSVRVSVGGVEVVAEY